jgi:outer membrane translocation and assembly module TamA
MSNEQIEQTPESSEQVEETTQASETNQHEAQASPQNEDNIRQLREARKKAEKERDEYLQRLKTYEEQQKKQEVPPVERDPSDLVEWRDVQTEISKLKQEINQYQQQTFQSTTETRLKSQYPDIEQVLTADNIDKLKESDPELAAMIDENQNLYTKASVAYKYIKKMGIYSDKNYDKEKETITHNSTKPRSSSAAGQASPLSEMNNFIDNPEEHRKKLYKDMVACAKNL